MDISCDLLVSELAPIDSLIQRAGRCARWGGEGKVVVFGIPHHAPYDKELVNKTEAVIQDLKTERLTWTLEKRMVDEVLEDAFMEFARPEAGSKAMMYLSKGAFEGKPATAEKAVRDALSVEVSIHDDPISLGNRVFSLPKCRMHPGTLKGFIREKNPRVWLIEQDRNSADDYNPAMEAIPIGSESNVYPNRLYVIHSDHASYNPGTGLMLGKKGDSLNPIRSGLFPKDNFFDTIPFETWESHASKTIDSFEEYILPEEDFTYSKLTIALGIDKEKLLKLFRLILALHDTGKLTEEWQQKIGRGEVFLAHSGNREKVALPPHATVSAYILRDYIRENWGNIVGDASFFAIAYHHSVRAAKVPAYKLCNGWYDTIDKVLFGRVGERIEWGEVKQFEVQTSPTTLGNHFPSFEKEKCYLTYY